MKNKFLSLLIIFVIAIQGCTQIPNDTHIKDKENEIVQEVEQKYITIELYNSDANLEKVEKFKAINIKEDLSLKEKLTYLCSKLSEEVFNNLKIEVKDIETISNKKIAVINLVENEEFMNTEDDSKYQLVSWSNKYFQGTTGGMMTTSILTKTFLQRDLKSEWIDGVTFLYNDKEVDFQHVERLNGITFR